MIVILCNSFGEAQDSYDVFVSFLNDNEPWSIKNAHNASYCVDTDDDLRYIFVDYRFERLFREMDCIDFIGVDEFFEGIEEYYFGGEEGI